MKDKFIVILAICVAINVTIFCMQLTHDSKADQQSARVSPGGALFITLRNDNGDLVCWCSLCYVFAYFCRWCFIWYSSERWRYRNWGVAIFDFGIGYILRYNSETKMVP